ncbi:DUF2163 domain-containing protein [Paracoccus ravus]|uniref:DUF2163 domain-containing protein n=1 Tax=Paracoccus ravus TaxID=2447760 RepID=UPI00106DDAA3|nr:DUF2163 domain-containing protein [Paracoccus ravus]
MKGDTIARAWAISRSDGMALGFTDHDCAFEFDGLTFRPEAGLNARAIAQGTGLSVDNSEAVGVLSDEAIRDVDLLAGRWDGADIRIWEVDWQDLSRRVLIFRGGIGEVSHSGVQFRAELRGLSEPLNRAQGRVYHPRCSAELGDRKCGVDLTSASHAAEAEVVSVDEAQRIVLSGGAGHEEGWFSRGEMIVLDGAAQGLRGVVKSDSANSGSRRTVELWAGLGIRPAPGDKVRLIAGCDKRAETCRLKFLNFLNFRGFPHLPSEDWLLAPQVVR